MAIQGITGPKIREMAYKALTDVKSNWQARQKPVISGGGVGSLEDIEYRLNVLGADAVAIGTMFTLSPTLPNQINSQLKLKPKRECPECGSTYTSSFLTRAPAALRDATTVTVRQCKETPCAFAWMDDEASNQLTLAQFKREKRMGLRRSRFCTPEEKELWDKA
jgi:tRNA-dihydrouridine synthase